MRTSKGSASKAQDLDAAQIAAEWLRAIRGGRSQLAFSRWLGYQSNIVYRWEAAECAPAASVAIKALSRVGGGEQCVLKSLSHFYGQPPPWLLETLSSKASRPIESPVASEVVASLISDLRGATPISHLANTTGYSRFAISRWEKGQNAPSLPQLLKLVEASTGRLLDFISCFTPMERLPSLVGRWQTLCEARELAYEMPWTHGVLKVLTLSGYLDQPQHNAQWLSAQLGVPISTIEKCLTVLEQTGQVRWTGSHYQEFAPESVDTRADPERAREAKQFWLRVSEERLNADAPGLFSYNLSAISRDDRKRLMQLQRQHYRRMSRIIAASSPAECVVLYNTQLLALGAETQ